MSLSYTISQNIGNLRKSLKIYNDSLIANKCFLSFLLPMFEYCSPVWNSAAPFHLKLLDDLMKKIKTLIPDLTVDLAHRRTVASICMFYKIRSNSNHFCSSLLPPILAPGRNTRSGVALNSLALMLPFCRTNQHQRSFIPLCSAIWNVLPDDVVN